MKPVLRILTVILLVVFVPVAAYAIPEKNFTDSYKKTVIPFFLHNGSSESFVVHGGISVAYRYHHVQNEKGAIVILSGRGESYVQYAELIYDFATQGYSVYLLDHRGQGFSGRQTKDLQVGYVRRFQDYVDDFSLLMNAVVSQRHHPKLYLFAHSMGGAIGTLYLAKKPGVFDAAVLSAPMFELNTGKYSHAVAVALANFNCLIGLGKKYAPGQTPYWPESFVSNRLTHSEVRFRAHSEMLAAYPKTQLGGASNRWVQASFAALSEIQNEAKHIATPILMFQAGNDSIVRGRGQDLFCQKARSCRAVRLSESFHDIFRESDSIREPAMRQALEFFAAH